MVTIPLHDVVPGEVVVLNAGDVIPGDGRVLEAHRLLVDEASLTGEPYPAEKEPFPEAGPQAEHRRSAYMGTHVLSGTGTVVIGRTGSETMFGRVVLGTGAVGQPSSFERGVSRFGLLLARAATVLIAVIFGVNLLLERPLVEAFLFSLALAVGLTPQLLPAIVAVSLASGARRMARDKVIVRRMDAIEDFGAMTVLCTDKTGTLTSGRLRLELALDPLGNPDPEVLRLAGLNAGLQRGYANPVDEAILAVAGTPTVRSLDEVPYDFSRKRLSVLVSEGDTGEATLVTKGAFEQILTVCTSARVGRLDASLEEVRDDVHRQFRALSTQGYRVLAVATRSLPGGSRAAVSDEQGMTLRGLLALDDPPRPDAGPSLRRLQELGVSVRVVTGDHLLAALHTATAVGLPTQEVLTGADIDALDDAGLARHAAAVGISVDTAVDAAKQAAAIVLLDKNLDVVADGVTLGRQTFANTLKYIRVTVSANFGNVLSMAVAAVALPFLPLLPRQVLLLNFISDIPAMTIARDSVEAELLDRPRSWNVGSLRRFMVAYGLLSTTFDLVTFAVLRLGFHADATLFRSAWFIESTLTELAAMLLLRTNRPAWRSRPAAALLMSSTAVAVLAAVLPVSPVAAAFGFAPVPMPVLAAMLGLVGLYAVANEVLKRRLPPA